VYIAIEGRYTYLGRFDEEGAAARKYDEHAAALGKLLNFPDEREQAFKRFMAAKSSRWVPRSRHSFIRRPFASHRCISLLRNTLMHL